MTRRTLCHYAIRPVALLFVAACLGTPGCVFGAERPGHAATANPACLTMSQAHPGTGVVSPAPVAHMR